MERKPISKEERMEADIVVIGAGGCGLAASVAAAEKGAKVILLEKKGGGGNSIMAWGLLAADSPTQKRETVYTTKDQVFEAAMEHFHWRVNPRIWRAFVNKSGDTIQWLEDKGIKFNIIPNVYPEQVLRTWHCTDAIKVTGPILFKTLRKECEKLGVRFLTQCPVKKILTDSKGGVTGVLAKTKEGELKVTAKSVIIATGGYGGNKELLKRYHSNYDENMHYTGYKFVTGDGILMAEAIGANTDEPGCLMICCHAHWPKVPPHIANASMQPSAIWVNKRGKRFFNEALGFRCGVGANAIDIQPDKCVYSLFDEKVKRSLMEEGTDTLGLPENGAFAGTKLIKLEELLQSESGKGEVLIADSWDEIAKWIGVAPKVLKATIDEYNSFCEQGYDAIFNKRRRYLQALRTPPYYAIRRRSLGFLTAIGGIKINHHMEVLNKQDNSIPGLYAGGDTTAGWEEGTYNKELPGSAFGFAINSGRIAGENATKYALGK